MSEADKTGRWPVWALALLMYPLAILAVGVNLFFLSLMGQAIGLEVLSTLHSLIVGVVLGIPVAWLTGRWLRGLIDEAEDSP